MSAWRARVAAARKKAVAHAHLVGIHPKASAFEQQVSAIGHLQWLHKVWVMRDRAWLQHYWTLRPKLMCIHYREGAWNAYNPAGYYGGLQMDAVFMRTFGYDKLVKYSWRDARAWSPTDQLAVGMRAVRARGFWPWYNSASACGLL